MKSIIKLTYTLLTALFLSACGDGSDDIAKRSNSIIVDCNGSNIENSINDCGDNTVPDYYTCLESGDIIVKNDNNTTIKIFHYIDNNKKVCVQNGSAYIVRHN